MISKNLCTPLSPLFLLEGCLGAKLMFLQQYIYVLVIDKLLEILEQIMELKKVWINLTMCQGHMEREQSDLECSRITPE